MSRNRDVSWFTQYYAIEQDRSSATHCVYFTRSGDRCKNNCSNTDSAHATVLRDKISSAPSEAIALDLLQEYVLYNCCKKGRHRRKMNENGLLIPLAARWQAEIRRERGSTIFLAQPDITLKSNVKVRSQRSISCTDSKAGRCKCVECQGVHNTYESRGPSKDLVHSELTRARTLCPCDWCAKPLKTEVPSVECAPRYELRNRNISRASTLSQIDCISEPLPPKFRAHKENPRPTDTVFYQIQTPIKVTSKNAKPGEVYIFDRDSSPGYVKVGWSSVSTESRLTSWSNCGYKPNLLFKTDRIRYAQRVESLAHYELIKEWRREVNCRCGVSHQEWFEIAPFRAKHVVEDWADWISLAEPYDLDGYLRLTWQRVVRDMDSKGEQITGKALLKYYYSMT